MANPVNNGDVWIPRIVVSFLGLVSLTSVIAAAMVTWHHGDVPPVIAALGTSSITALGTLATLFYGSSKNGPPASPGA